MIGATAARVRLIGPNAVGARVLGLSIMEPPGIIGHRINPTWGSARLIARPGDGLHRVAPGQPP